MNVSTILSPIVASFHAPLKNDLVISAATYSVEIYTPDTNLKNVYRLKVRIVGENDEQTGENVLADPLTTPKTEVKGYVIYQTLETVWRFQYKNDECADADIGFFKRGG